MATFYKPTNKQLLLETRSEIENRICSIRIRLNIFVLNKRTVTKLKRRTHFLFNFTHSQLQHFRSPVLMFVYLSCFRCCPVGVLLFFLLFFFFFFFLYETYIDRITRGCPHFVRFEMLFEKVLNFVYVILYERKILVYGFPWKGLKIVVKKEGKLNLQNLCLLFIDTRYKSSIQKSCIVSIWKKCIHIDKFSQAQTSKRLFAGNLLLLCFFSVTQSLKYRNSLFIKFKSHANNS